MEGYSNTTHCFIVKTFPSKPSRNFHLLWRKIICLSESW